MKITYIIKPAKNIKIGFTVKEIFVVISQQDYNQFKDKIDCMVLKIHTTFINFEIDYNLTTNFSISLFFSEDVKLVFYSRKRKDIFHISVTKEKCSLLSYIHYGDSSVYFLYHYKLKIIYNVETKKFEVIGRRTNKVLFEINEVEYGFILTCVHKQIKSDCNLGSYLIKEPTVKCVKEKFKEIIDIRQEYLIFNF